LPRLGGATPPALLCAVLNRLLAQNDQARALLAQHVGCTFEIQARPIQAKLTIETDGKLSPADADVVSQVCLTLDTAALIKLGWRPGQPLPEQPGLLHVSGDVAMAQTLSTLAKHWRPDLEDLLAQRIGDVPARQVLRVAQGVLSTVWRSSYRLAENVAEYATHETQTITGVAAFDAFKADRAALSAKVSTLEERLQHLQQRLERTLRSHKT
jgi:ubiquinone biosynthesis accessory factor UbiJ